MTTIDEFLEENNHIEGIYSDVTDAQKQAFDKFLALDKITIEDMVELIQAFQPDARLRDKYGLNVRVGNYFPPRGGAHIRKQLNEILGEVNVSLEINSSQDDAYIIHHAYETLHPFTDGNGRSGRMLWWRMMGDSKLGFLHHWDSQSLSMGR